MAHRGKGMRLTTRFALLISCVALLVLGAYLGWSVHAQHQAAESKALAEARVLNSELNAIWNYINDQQSRINYNSDGSYDFKGVYCTIAAKNIAQRFMRDTDYVIRYVRENPRTATDEPDEFELEAMAAYSSDGVEEYHAVTVFEGEPALRYATILLAEFNCLKCHGEPAGAFDEIGYIKEGMSFGDLAGLTSIVIPLAGYESEVNMLVARDFLLAAALVMLVGMAIWLGLRTWVTRPLALLNEAAREIGQGNFAPALERVGARGEITDLVDELSLMAKELEAFYDVLESKVSERTAELERVNEKLKQVNKSLTEANAYKSNFLTIVSHELRTPMTSIIAFTDILSRLDCGEDERGMIGEIRYNAQILLDMINNVIDAAKIEAGRFQLDVVDVDLVDVVNAVEGMVTPLARRKNVTVTSSVTPDIPILRSDKNVLYRILSNLVGNAVKFTDEGGIVTVAARRGTSDDLPDKDSLVRDLDDGACLYETTRDMIILSVVDNGIGIERENLPGIFERFASPDSSLSRKYGGSGLGLSIVRDLVNELNGLIDVDSEPGRGSAFTVYLPLTEGRFCDSSGPEGKVVLHEGAHC